MNYLLNCSIDIDVSLQLVIKGLEQLECGLSHRQTIVNLVLEGTQIYCFNQLSSSLGLLVRKLLNRLDMDSLLALEFLGARMHNGCQSFQCVPLHFVVTLF